MLEKSFGDDEVLEHGTLDWSIQNAQKKVEQQNYSIRKRLLQYDDVLNKQREIVYAIRNDVLLEEDPGKILMELVEEELDSRLAIVQVAEFKSQRKEDMPELESLLAGWVNVTFPLSLQLDELVGKNEEEVQEHIFSKIQNAYEAKRKLEDPDQLQSLERYVVVNAVDVHWQDHLTEMDELRRSVGLRGYGQKDPLSEYKNEAFRAFEEMMVSMRSDVCSGMFRSSTNLAAFENMLSNQVESLGQQVQTQIQVAVLIDFLEARRRVVKALRQRHQIFQKLPPLWSEILQRLAGMNYVHAEAVKSIRNVVVLEFQLNHLVQGRVCQIKGSICSGLDDWAISFFHPLIKFSLYFFIFFLCY